MNNNSYSEGVLVKNELTGEVLTVDLMIKTIRSEVSKFYYSYSNLRRYYELEDIVQDIVCYYFSPMKKIPKTRLVHYSELYDNNIKYLINLFKLTSRQWLNMLCRNRDVQNNPISLNTVITNKAKLDGHVTELQDLIKDDSCVSTISLLLDKEFISEVVEDLKQHNFDVAYKKEYRVRKLAAKLDALNNNEKFKDSTFDFTKSDFRQDTTKMKELDLLVERQYELILDIIDGCSKVELRSKYPDFSSLLKVIKIILERRIESL